MKSADAVACEICGETGAPALWSQICGECWLGSVADGVHAVSEIPAALRDRVRLLTGLEQS